MNAENPVRIILFHGTHFKGLTKTLNTISEHLPLTAITIDDYYLLGFFSP